MSESLCSRIWPEKNIENICTTAKSREKKRNELILQVFYDIREYVLEFNGQVKLRNKKPSQCIEYKQFFKKFYKVLQSGTIKRTRVFVA